MSPAARAPQLMRDIAVGLAIFAGYLFTAAMQSSATRQAAAAANGRRIIDLERVLNLDVEPALNGWLVSQDVLRVTANYWYAGAYLAVTAAAVSWLYWRRPAGYLRMRRAFLLATAVAVTTFALLPVMPPRLLPELGLTDTVTRSGTWGSWGSPLIESANRIAAMPSVHVVWAAWVALFVVSVTSRPLPRVAAVSHVLITTFVIVATANHYVLDAVAGAAVALVCFAAAGRGTTERVQASDAFFLYVESPAYPQLVGGVAMLDTSAGMPSREDLVELVRVQLHRLPRFRQRLMPPSWWRRPRWVAHTQLDWNWHVQVRDVGDARQAQPDDGLSAVVAEVQATPLPQDRPRWRLILARDADRDRAAAILVVHHALSDGLGTIMQAMTLLEPVDGMQLRPPYPPRSDRPWRRLRRAWTVVAGLAQLASDGRPDRRLVCGDDPARQFGMVSLQLAEIRELAARCGVGITDVLLAAVAGASRCVSVDQVGELRVAVPLLARGASSTTEGNITGGLIIDLPVDARPEADRLAEVARRRRHLLSSSRVTASRFVVRWAGLLPVPMHAWFARTVYGSRYFQAIVTNIPGPDGQFSLAGSPLRQVYPIVPLAPGAPLAVGSLSWSGSLCIGITADPALAENVSELSDAIAAVLDELAAHARDLSGRTGR